MSGSPKYSQLSIAADAERVLRERRKREAEAALVIREQLENERRQKRLENAKKGASSDAAATAKALADASKEDWSGLVDQGERQTIEQDLKELQRQITAAGTEAQVSKATGALRSLSDRARALRQAARQALAEQQNRQAAERVTLARTEFAEVDPAAAEKFNPAGYSEIARMLDQSQRQADAGQSAAAMETVKAAQTFLAKHRQEVAARLAEWTARRDQANAALAQAADRLAAVSADTVVARWQSPQLANLKDAAALIQQSFEREEFDAVQSKFAQVTRQAQEIVEAAGADQLAEDRRNHIVKAMQEALLEQGFNVADVGSENPDDPRSRFVFEAQRRTGEVISIAVPRTGPVCYDVDGFAMHTQTDAQGKITKTCDAAERELTALQDVLKERFGVDSDGIHWEGKPDDIHLSKTAVDLPKQQDRSRYQG